MNNQVDVTVPVTADDELFMQLAIDQAREGDQTPGGWRGWVRHRTGREGTGSRT